MNHVSFHTALEYVLAWYMEAQMLENKYGILIAAVIYLWLLLEGWLIC